MLLLVVIGACAICASADGVLYRPNVDLTMKNTTVFWRRRARQHGLNVCAEETLWNPSLTFDTAWTSGEMCVPTTIKFGCCNGYSPHHGEPGCPVANDVDTALATASKLGAGQFYRFLNSGGVQNYFNELPDVVTIFAPLDTAIQELSPQIKWSLEQGVARARHLEDMPALMGSHIVLGRQLLKDLQNEKILLPHAGQPAIRINKYPNGLITANCIPIVRRDIVSLDATLQITSKILPQNHQFSIFDTVLRHTQSRRFANLLVQSRLENLLRSDGPYTLFLPTDSALESLDHIHIHMLRNDKTALESLVLSHIVSGSHCSAMLYNARLLTHQGLDLRSRCEGSSMIKINNVAGIVEKDIIASNGVVHTINSVLMPDRAMLISDLLKSLQLTNFVALAERGNLISMLKGEEAITVFAPTNKALKGMLSLNEHEARTLILNHIASGRKEMTQMQSKGNRSPFTLKQLQYNRLVDAAVIRHPSIQGLNGVVHIIDRILDKPSDLTVIQYMERDGRFRHFVDALKTVGLHSFVNDRRNANKMTIFAVPDSYASYSLYYRPQVLRNHILDHVMLSEEVPSGGRYKTKTIGGYDLQFTRRGDFIYAGASILTQCDILCADGVLHIAREIINL